LFDFVVFGVVYVFALYVGCFFSFLFSFVGFRFVVSVAWFSMLVGARVCLGVCFESVRVQSVFAFVALSACCGTWASGSLPVVVSLPVSDLCSSGSAHALTNGILFLANQKSSGLWLVLP
jgi:hypothetical protein